jgi:hypothetical protein
MQLRYVPANSTVFKEGGVDRDMCLAKKVIEPRNNHIS